MSAITFQCYACNQVLQVEADKAGRKAKCSQCGTILTIPALTAEALAPGAASQPPPPDPPPRRPSEDDEPRRRDRYDDDYDDRPRRRRRGSYDDYALGRPAEPKWDRVQVGLLLVFIGLCVMGGAFVFTVLGNVIGFLSLTGARILAQIGFTIMLLGTIATVVGHVFCLFVLSNRRGAMGFAIAGLAVCGVYVLMQLVTLIQLYGSMWGYSHGGWLLTHLLRAAHLMMIAFYLRSLALWLDDPPLQSKAMLNVILTGCLAGFDLVAGIILMSMAPTIFNAGESFLIAHRVFGLLGGAFVIVIYVFTLLALHRGRLLVEACRAADPRPTLRDDRW